MSLFNLKKNDRITVKVLEKRQFSNKAIFEVEYMGRKCQVPMFEYQKHLPLPDEIECVVQSVNDYSLFLQQNIAQLLRENYSQNQIYEFTVAQDYTTTSTPHYKLTDGTGFFFKLPATPDLKFTKNRKIRCRIKRIRGVEVDLEYVGIVHEMNESFKVKVLIDKIGIDAVKLLRHFRSRTPDSATGEIADIYESGSPEWLPRAIEYAIGAFGNAPLNHVNDNTLALIGSLRRCVVWFLEDSDYFDKFPEDDRYKWQTRFGLALRNIDALKSAYEIIVERSQQHYISQIVQKFKVSGYLINAAHKLLTLQTVLTIDPRGLIDVIDELLAVVTDRRADCLRDDTFRRAFIDLFQLYIDNNSHRLDEMDEAETAESKAALHTMVRVLAIQLLLAADTPIAELTGIDFELNRSRLYRYLTLQNNSGDAELINKSLLALLACETWRTEYTWKDVDEIIKLSTRLRQPNEVATLPATFESAAAALHVNETTIEIDDNSGEAEVEVFPGPDTELWHGMKIYLESPLPANLRQPRTIAQFRRFWNEVERRLTNPAANGEAEATRAEIKTVPSRGQDVEIEIYGVDPDNRERYRCRVVEIGMRGEGFIDKKEITSANQELPVSFFADEHGQPMVFPATVIGGNSDDSIEFSLSNTLNDYFNSIISYTDRDVCAILKKIGDSCTVLSQRGFTLNVDIDSDHDYLEPGDVICVTNIQTSANWREGEFVSETGGRLDFATVIRNMLRDFALKDLPDDDGDDDTGDDDSAEGQTIQEANRMSAAAVAELIRIIESVASKVRENRVAYNYYAYARLMARMIDDENLAGYFDKRCQLLEEFDDFSTNGRVDLEHINTLMVDLVKHNNSLSNDGEKLRILSVLDHPENNGYLWGLFNSSANESLQELARLVLAYNMLDGFKMAQQRQEIRQKLYSKLKINIEKQPTVIAGGLEGLKVEFKTSIAYPANSMRLDVLAQTMVILKVITSFLNTEGGTLYIGVSDEGYVRGLEADLNYFRSKDSFDRHIHDNIRKHLTFIPNRHDFIETQWIENGGKEIYVVKVKPISEPIELDGVYYYREGSSCVMVRSEQEPKFIASRRATAHPSAEGAAPARRALTEPAAATQATAAPEPTASTSPHADNRTDDFAIATSELRNNVLHDGYEGYEAVSDYIYFFGDGTFEVSDMDRWQESSSALTLGIHPAERNGSLAVVTADGYGYRLNLATLGAGDRRLSAKSPAMFISPVNDSDKLIAIYRTADGDLFKRIFAAADLRQVKAGSRGEKLDSNIAEVLFCEVVEPDAQSLFKSLVRERRIGKDLFEQERSTIMTRLRKK